MTNLQTYKNFGSGKFIQLPDEPPIVTTCPLKLAQGKGTAATGVTPKQFNSFKLNNQGSACEQKSDISSKYENHNEIQPKKIKKLKNTELISGKNLK